jgi:uncharacterized protein (DUF58 family)
VSPTARVAVLLALAGLSVLVVPFPVALGLVAVVALVTAVDWSYARRRPLVAREAPVVAARGVAADLTVEVVVGPAVKARVRQPRPADVGIEPAEAAGGLDAELRARRRGRHVLPPVVVRQDHTVGGGHEVQVYPDLPNARRLAHQVRTGRFRDPGERPRGPRGLGTEFETIRDYQPDDDVRQINWRATDRLQRPMSNQFREDTERDVVCAVDAGRLMAAPIGERTRLDIALDAVAAVAAVADVVGDRCGAVAFDAATLVECPPARRAGRAVVDALHDLEPSDLDSDYEHAFATLGRAKRALVMVFTDLLDDAAARPLLEAMPVLTRRHAVVVVSVLDDRIDTAASAAPADAGGAYAMVAALDALAVREAAVANLTRRGATVVQGPADSLPARCVGAYLRLKSRARI